MAEISFGAPAAAAKAKFTNGERWVDGSGLCTTDPDKLVGKLITARGYGKGTVEKYNKKRIGLDTFTVNFGVNGGRDVIELQLRRWRTGAAGVEFKVADVFDPEKPHRYSVDPPSPMRGWGEEGNLYKPHIKAFQELKKKLVAQGAASAGKDPAFDMNLLCYLRDAISMSQGRRSSS